MAGIALETGSRPIGDDTWAWWQARRLRYNLALAGAGIVAYAVTIVLIVAFGEPLWVNWQEAAGATIGLGAGYLVLMGIANVCYTLGPFMESVLQPTDADRFRRNAFGMGFWGSVALPFLFPLLNLSMLLSHAAQSGLPAID